MKGHPIARASNQEVEMKKTIFEGIGTAIITPLDENGVNYDQFGRMIDWQIEDV